MSTFSYPAFVLMSRAVSVLLLLSSALLVDADVAFATTTKTKSAKTVVVKSAKRSNTSTVVNTLLNGIGAPSASLGVNGDFYIDTVALNIYGPKSKNAWPIPKSLVGPQGVAGVPGKPGASGKDGRDGANGSNGVNGKDGERGPAGASGSGSGVAGPAGAVGPAGPAGAVGPAGPSGATGSTGAQGIQGLPGATGTAGAQGEVGPRGLQGLQGDAGPTGATGSAGAQGIQGLTGAAGSNGAQGPAGTAGAAGAQGIQGPAGAVGPAGPVKVFFGSIEFAGVLSGTPGTTKQSTAFATLNTGKKYLLRAEVFASANSLLNYYLSGTISVVGAAIVPVTKFSTQNGNSLRNSNMLVESRVSLVSTIDGSGVVGSDYQIVVSITCGDATSNSDDRLSLAGYYTIEEVTSIN